MTTVLDINDRLSDFEDAAAATITMDGTPARNGYWYSYNDMSATCMQTPAKGVSYLGSTPPTASPYKGGMALHAVWNMCNTWGAGVGADLNQPAMDGGTNTGPKVPYDLTPYTGITFWAMGTMPADTNLRVKLPMTDDTKIADGGLCDETDPTIGTGKCSDDFGFKFAMPTNGTWKQVTVKFTDPAFKQEGWGHVYPWMPSHVTSVQIQSSDMGESYDFWIDDVYLTK